MVSVANAELLIPWCTMPGLSQDLGPCERRGAFFPWPPSDFRASLSMAHKRKGPDCSPSKKTPLPHNSICNCTRQLPADVGNTVLASRP